MRRVLHYLSYTLESIVVVTLAITAITTFLQVFYRYVLASPLAWSQEVMMISFVYLVLFGAALGVKNKEHLRIDLLDNVPDAIKKVLKVLELIILLFFFAIFIYFGFSLVQANLQSGQTIGFLPIKTAYVYMAIPVSGLFMVYYTIKGVFR